MHGFLLIPFLSASPFLKALGGIDRNGKTQMKQVYPAKFSDLFDVQSTTHTLQRDIFYIFSCT